MSQVMLLLALLVVLLPLAVAKLFLDYQADRTRGSDKVTLTIGELERLVRRYVEDAAEPLRRRIEELERAREVDLRESDESDDDPFPLVDDPTVDGEDLRSSDDLRSEQRDNTA